LQRIVVRLFFDRDDEHPFVRAHHQQARSVQQAELKDRQPAAEVAAVLAGLAGAAAHYLAAVLGPRSAANEPAAAEDLTIVLGPSAVAQVLVLGRRGEPALPMVWLATLPLPITWPLSSVRVPLPIRPPLRSCATADPATQSAATATINTVRFMFALLKRNCLLRPVIRVAPGIPRRRICDAG
jgi:hypothetical protein